MTRDHKFADANVVLKASIPADRLAALAHHVGSSTGNSMSKVRLEGVAPGMLHFSVRNFGSKCPGQITFHLEIRDAGTGSTARSSIDGYHVTQSRYMGFIPTSRWKMLGYTLYKRFMINLGDAAKCEDPAADVAITQRTR